METVAYRESSASIANPERGWMVWSGRQSPASVFSDAREISGLVRVDFELNDFREAVISAEWLGTLDTYFNRVRTAGLKTIIHFEYCQAIGQDDATKARILGHITQLTPYLQAHADVIALMWGSFIGPWGEWHNSTNNLLNQADMTDILEAVLDALPASVPVALRYPIHKLTIFEDEVLDSVKAFDGSDISRVGHVNLALLATADDYNTYSDDNIEGEKNYVNGEARYVPTGGETANTQNINCVDIPAEIERLRWSYMSDSYHPGAIAILQAGGCWDSIERQLGYRLVLTQARYFKYVMRGHQLTMDMTIENTGVAAPFKERPFSVVLKGPETVTLALSADPREWLPGDTDITESVTLPAEMSAGEYSIYLSLPDLDETLAARPEYSVRLANSSGWDSANGLNLVGKIKVAATG